MTSTVHDIIQFARENTEYYRNLYESVQQNDLGLEAISITDLDDYWKLARADPANVLTGPFVDGKAYCISGPKNNVETVYLTKNEVRDLSKVKAILWSRALNLRKGDRITNVMTPRDLHVGFWEMVNLFNGVYAPAESAQLLISNEKLPDKIVEEIAMFNTNTLFGSVSDLIRIAKHCSESHTVLPSIRTILYHEASILKSPNLLWRDAFPNAKLFAPLYDKLDLGPLGVPAPITTREDRDIEPIYKVCESVVILEIMTDDSTVIKGPGVKGNIVITHLIRRLQPIVRYPLGDVAEWVDYESQTFKYHGKAPPKIKLAKTTLDLSLVKEMINNIMEIDVSNRFQCVLRRHNASEKLVIRLAFRKPGNAGEVRHKIEKALWRSSSRWKYDRSTEAILSLRLEWVDESQLDYDEGTGRLQDIVDER